MNHKEDITVVTSTDAAYPALLKEIPQAPPELYVRGTLREHAFPLAVVGTRKMSHYGEQILEKIVRPVAESGCTIISGLALGVDGRAHEIALDAGAYTIAVLGCGVDDERIYPPQHRDLARKIIASGGAVISEFPPGTPPLKENFPQRNRIISGMSQGTLVVEAAERSGSLITGRMALDQNRNVYAIPGSILAEASHGTNALIKMGAKCVTSATDILEDFGLVTIEKKNKKIEITDPLEQQLLALLSHDPLHIDDLVAQLRLPPHIAMSHLTMLETKGIVKQIGFMKFVKTL